MNLMENNARAIPSMSQLRVARDFIGRFVRPALLLALLLACFCGPRYTAQQRGGSSGNIGSPTTLPSMDQNPLYQGRAMPGEPGDPVAQERRMKALNTARQKSMVEDTNKLLKLTTELNEEVNGAHPQPLNSDQLRKVAQIEKLAHSVREKMSSTVGVATQFLSPMPIPITGIQ
jgi:hypothetical protein